MILLDTNVISELFKSVPEQTVVDWLASQPTAMVFTTAITYGELLYGVKRMPDGQRKNTLLRGLNRLFDVQLSDRVLDYDSGAADAYAEIAASRRVQGRPLSQPDAMIAGIARARGASLATRNVKDFHDCGIEVIDPWTE